MAPSPVIKECCQEEISISRDWTIIDDTTRLFYQNDDDNDDDVGSGCETYIRYHQRLLCTKERTIKSKAMESIKSYHERTINTTSYICSAGCPKVSSRSIGHAVRQRLLPSVFVWLRTRLPVLALEFCQPFALPMVGQQVDRMSRKDIQDDQVVDYCGLVRSGKVRTVDHPNNFPVSFLRLAYLWGHPID